MLRTCGFPGCSTLTLSSFCIAHEERTPLRVWPRGRPFVAHTTALDEVHGHALLQPVATDAAPDRAREPEPIG